VKRRGYGEEEGEEGEGGELGGVGFVVHYRCGGAGLVGV
jgi:hypothetical protein